MKTKDRAVVKVEIDDKGAVKIFVNRGRFQDISVWGILLADIAKAVADAHGHVENPRKTMELLRMKFLEDIGK